MHVNIPMCLYMCAYMYGYACSYAYMNECMCGYLHDICFYVCMYVHYACMYAHTHTHTHIVAYMTNMIAHTETKSLTHKHFVRHFPAQVSLNLNLMHSPQGISAFEAAVNSGNVEIVNTLLEQYKEHDKVRLGLLHILVLGPGSGPE